VTPDSEATTWCRPETAAARFSDVVPRLVEHGGGEVAASENVGPRDGDPRRAGQVEGQLARERSLIDPEAAQKRQLVRPAPWYGPPAPAAEDRRALHQR
jgi:hypothetical protein